MGWCLHGDGLQVRVHSRSVGEAQKGLGRVADAGRHQSAVWGAADGARHWLVCKLWVEVSQVVGASLQNNNNAQNLIHLKNSQTLICV